jgi:glycine cleavage system aminomethyltransferase T/glycine/D-amino acid oxidase-like deaminating enzyme
MTHHARVVVIGSGIAGASIAWHLTRLGWRDVLILEQGGRTCGTTSHAPGLVGQLRSAAALTRMLRYSVDLYRELRLDDQPGFFEVGSLRLATTADRLLELKRQEGLARAVGLEAGLIGLDEAHRRFPLMEMAGVRGALFLPSDGSARATILAGALLAGAEAGGARLVTDTTVTGFRIDDGRLRAVETSDGPVATEVAVSAAGIWSPRIGRMAGLAIPLLPMQHQYAASGPVAGLDASAPVPNLRDPDGLVYFRQDGTGIVLGGYERDPAPFEVAAIPASDNPTVHPFDQHRFAPLLAAARRRVPALAGAPLVTTVNGLESFTPDGEFILGEAPGVAGLWFACGFCAHGVSGAGGVGKAIADWIVHGDPGFDLWHMDIRRFGAATGASGFVSSRVHEVYRTYYDVALPGRERTSARNQRLSPLYSRLQALGASFGEKAGWERANWCEPNAALVSPADAPRPAGWAGRHWSPAIAAEHLATRERVALFDETSFSKIEIEGPGALPFLQWLAANDLDRPPGTVTYTQLLNERGGIECDLTINRLEATRFLAVTGTAFGQHDLDWMRRHLPPDGVRLTDVSERLCCIGMWGPAARDLLSRVAEGDVSNAAFPYLASRRLVIAGAEVVASRVTYVGELGWELYAPVEHGPAVWDALWEAGRPLGALAAGYRAIDSLRLEKGYRYWSADIDPEHDPFEAGLGFAVRMKKGEFLGRVALERRRVEPRRQALRCLVVADPAQVALGGEPVWSGADLLGRVTSAGYGYTVRQSIAYAWLPGTMASGREVEVELFGVRQRAHVSSEPLYDPRGERVRA